MQQVGNLLLSQGLLTQQAEQDGVAELAQGVEQLGARLPVLHYVLQLSVVVAKDTCNIYILVSQQAEQDGVAYRTMVSDVCNHLASHSRTVAACRQAAWRRRVRARTEPDCLAAGPVPLPAAPPVPRPPPGSPAGGPRRVGAADPRILCKQTMRAIEISLPEGVPNRVGINPTKISYQNTGRTVWCTQG